MDLSQAPPAPPSSFLFQPIMVAMIGIVATAVVLLCYHFIFFKYCTRSRSTATTSQQQPPKGSGVEEWIINIIPVQNYTKHQDFSTDQSQCAVCLAELEEGEQVRLLPNCRHDFHVQCIDEWFISHSNCPLCRSPILPTPPEAVATPGTEGESEVTTQSPSKDPVALLRPCASFVLPSERKPPAVLLGALKRSLSMDFCSYVSLRTEYDLTQSSSSLPSSKLADWRTQQSQKRLDRGSPY